MGKSETLLYIRLNNHRNDIKNPTAIEAIQHFNNTFHKHGKFMQIEQMNIIKITSTEILKRRLKDRENYWIKRQNFNSFWFKSRTK